jgi:hypothetical protein
MIRHKLQVFADYHQFYLWDPGTNPLAPTDYTDQDVRNMVKVSPGVVVIQPGARYDRAPQPGNP